MPPSPPPTRDPAKAGPRRAVIVHDLEGACLTMEAAKAFRVPVTLVSAPGAAAYLGPAAFKAIAREARARVPEADASFALDCGGDAGTALNAIRHGIDAIRFHPATAPRPDKTARAALAKVRDIASQSGCRLDEDDAPALDLKAASDPAVALADWLKGA